MGLERNGWKGELVQIYFIMTPKYLTTKLKKKIMDGCSADAYQNQKINM